MHPHIITLGNNKEGETRAKQMDYIKNNIGSKLHIWFYFDLHQAKWLFLNGQVRTKAASDYTYSTSNIKYLSFQIV